MLFRLKFKSKVSCRELANTLLTILAVEDLLDVIDKAYFSRSDVKSQGEEIKSLLSKVRIDV